MEKWKNHLPRDSGYQIIRCLGSGGEGTVYLVCHLVTEQLRAAKVLKNIGDDRKHELNMMKHLKHPSLPGVIDVLEEDGVIWLVMEYIHGLRLDHVAAKGMTETQIWSVARQLSEVLLYLHTRKEPVYHLDIKPSNILVRQDGSIVLIDFGASIRGHPVQEGYRGYGTRGFAAPEQQVSGETIDERADIYGAGAVLYYCCFRCSPESSQGQGVRYKISHAFLQAPPDSRRLRDCQLKHIIERCLAHDRQERYRDSRQFYKAVCSGWRWRQWHISALKAFGASILLVVTVLLLFHSIASEKQVYVDSAFAWEETETSSLYAETENETESFRTKKQEYDRQLNMAGGMGYLQAMECYEKASVLCPDDETWYLELLDYVTADGLFEQEEEEGIKELFYAVQQGTEMTALELLEENHDAYGRVAYRVGLAYWYFYEGSGGKSAASWWFQRALSSQEEERSCEWTASALILARIGSYYGMLGNTGADAERIEKEGEYWKDLQQLWNLYQVQEEDWLIKCETASELLSQVVLKAYELRQCGISREEMLQVVTGIDEFIMRDIEEENTNKRELLREQSEAAYSAVDRAFQK